MTEREGFAGRTGNEEFDRILAQIGKQMEEFAAVREELTELRGRGEAAGGLVIVDVLPSGALSAVEIDPRAMRLGSEALAEAIMDAAHQAMTDANSRLDELTKPIFGQSLDFKRLLQGSLFEADSQASADNETNLDKAMAALERMRRTYGV